MELEECLEDILKVFWEFEAEILMSLLKYCLKKMTFTFAVNRIQVYQRISNIQYMYMNMQDVHWLLHSLFSQVCLMSD